MLELLESEYKYWKRTHTSKKSQKADPFPTAFARAMTKGMGFLLYGDKDAAEKIAASEKEYAAQAEQYLKTL